MLLCIYFIQHCFICRPSDSSVSADAGIEIYIRLAASNRKILRALAASCMQSCQFFATTLRAQLFELKIKDAVQKNLRVYATHVLAKAYQVTQCMAQSRETVKFKVNKFGLCFWPPSLRSTDSVLFIWCHKLQYIM